MYLKNKAYKDFSDKQKVELSATKISLKKILKDIFHVEGI